MHGLPTEKVAERQLGLKNGKDEILKVLGVNNFIEKCREVCTQNLLDMNKTFESLGIKQHIESDSNHFRNMDGL
jgi:isoleucyl-tRNA synthetase